MKDRKGPGAKAPRNFQVIDLVRTLAILPVLALHLKPTLPLPPPAFRWGWDHFQRNGGYGVAIFFVVSGFLITRILAEGPRGPFRASWRSFYVRRIGRIFPLFFLTLALGLLIYALFHDDSKKFNYCFKLPTVPWDGTFWGPLVLFSYNWARCFWESTWGGVGRLWGVCWSLSVEEQFYFFYPLVLRGLKDRERLFRFLGLVILLGPLYRWWAVLHSTPDHNWQWGSFACFDLIAIGAALYFSHKRSRDRLVKDQRLSVLLAAGGFFVLMAVYWGTFEADDPVPIYGPSLIGLGVFLFLLGGLNLEFFESPFWRPLTWPGKYSYGNYLFHLGVLYFIHAYLWDLNIVVAFLVFASACTGTAALSFHFFETPVNRWIRKRFSPKLS